MTTSTETDPITTTEAATLEDAAAGHDAAEQDNGNAEAAKYRRRAQHAEARAATLTSQVTSMQRAEIERQVAATGVSKPAAIWSAGHDLAAFLDDDGNVSAEKVTALTADAVEQLGLKIDNGFVANDTGATRHSDKPVPASWAAALKSSG